MNVTKQADFAATRNRFSAIAGACALLFCSPATWAACVDDSTRAVADAGSQCAATAASYAAGTDALRADGTGSVLTSVGATRLNPDGVDWTDFNQAVAAAANGGTLILAGNTDIANGGAPDSFGLAATAGGSVQTQGDLTVLIAGNAGGRRGVLAEGAGSSIEIGGRSSIKAEEPFVGYHTGLHAKDGGSIRYAGLDLDFLVNGRSEAIWVDGATSSIEDTGETTLTSGQTDAIGIRSSGAYRTSGKLTAYFNLSSNETDQARSAILVERDGSVSIGANSVLEVVRGNAVELYSDGAASTPAFSAASGLRIESRQHGSFAISSSAFLYNGPVNSSISLQTAAVDMQNTFDFVWAARAGATGSFTGQGGSFLGSSMVDGQSTLNINLSDAAVWQPALLTPASFTNLNLTSGAILRNPGPELTLTGNLQNTGGTLELSGPSEPVTFTLNGDYTGGGNIQMDVELLDNSSSADDIVINGDVLAGETTLSIRNNVGQGAQTTGDGILLIRVSGDSPAGAFKLDTPELRAGNYVYRLVQVGKNWYLQSSPASQPTPPGPTPPAPPATVTPVPALSHWGLMLMTALLAGFGIRQTRKRQR